jgi:hypothetical protein
VTKKLGETARQLRLTTNSHNLLVINFAGVPWLCRDSVGCFSGSPGDSFPAGAKRAERDGDPCGLQNSEPIARFVEDRRPAGYRESASERRSTRPRSARPGARLQARRAHRGFS